MPWRYYRYKRWRRRRPRYWRTRKTFRPRYYGRRRWVRRYFKPKRKLRKITLSEYQPHSIRKCTIKGMLCLFQTNEQRISYNFDMYEESIVPEKLPGGGGFSIKNISLQSLYEEHIMGHNVFTHSNLEYPLCRYRGTKLRFYQSANIDYIVTYLNSWPLRSNLKMYNSMQPTVHSLHKNKIIVPSRATKPLRKPYKTVFIPPPTQMKNQWYFQYNIANTPLFMLRTTATSLLHWYIGTRSQSTNITIISLNTTMIQNRKFNKVTEQYSNRNLGTIKYYLYSTKAVYSNIQNIKLLDLICLGNTQNNIPGTSYNDEFHSYNTTNFNTYKTNPFNYWGNPFHHTYLTEEEPVFTSSAQWSTILSKIEAKQDATIKDLENYPFQQVNLVNKVRYNPYKDKGINNECYFLSSLEGSHDWDPPSNPDLTNEHLPLWLLLFGFSDFQKKIGKLQQIDTSYMLVIKTPFTNPKYSHLVPISESFYEGNSPYEDKFNQQDQNRWYPCFQYQQEINNQICVCGPGTPKIAQGDTVEAKVEYKAYFKWGGEQPDLPLIENPQEKPTYPIPNNELQTTSLQNPTTRPETYLYRFDWRRHMLTKSATERIQKDWETKETPLFSTAPRFTETTETQTPQEETTSEEEEQAETLYQQLQQQRNKQLRLKHRIAQTLSALQKLE
nr:MAG: ORF1 [TTV-like mini virus]